MDRPVEEPPADRDARGVEHDELQPSLSVDGERALEWYRPDVSQRVRRALFPMMVPMALGVVLTGWAYTRLDVLDPFGRYEPATLQVEAASGPTPDHPNGGGPRLVLTPGVDLPVGFPPPEGGFGDAVGVEGPLLHQNRSARVARARLRRELYLRTRGTPDPTTTWIGFVLGLLLVCSGPLVAMRMIHELMREEDFLLVRTDGIVLQKGEHRVHFGWEELVAVRHDPEHDAVALEHRDGDELLIEERYADISPEELARRMSELRRKCLWGFA